MVRKRTYLELLISCSLNPDRLRKMLDDGVIAKEGDRYLLTDFGRDVDKLLNVIERESHSLFQKQVTRMRKQDRIDFSWALAERIANKLKTDSRVEAIWVSGSLARNEADEYNDLDMAALIEHR